MTMTTPTNAELARELAALRAQLAPAPAPKRRRARRFNLRRLTSLGIIGGLIALVPFSILAAHITITDLNQAAPEHRANIEAIAEGGITTGFDDPNSSDPKVRVYNPKDNVTREEMASFLARTAGLGDNPPVANAKTAQSVPAGAITPENLNPDGSTAGQVLTSTGSGVAFRDAPTAIGVPGPPGPQGPQGVPGAQGPAGLTTTFVRVTSSSVPAGGQAPVGMLCEAGEVATGGGFAAASPGLDIQASAPIPATQGSIPIGWFASAGNPTGADIGLSVYAVCAPATTPVP